MNDDLLEQIRQRLKQFDTEFAVSELDWSPQQRKALTSIHRWMDTDNNLFLLPGYAGTGKTTLASHILENGALFATYTNKAASVMRKKGCKNAKTIDRLIYTPSTEEYCRLKIECKPPYKLCCDIGIPRCQHRCQRWIERKLNKNSDAIFAKLVVIDEGSMVNYTMAQDLLAMCRKVLVLYDPAQLPPIEGAGYFTELKYDFFLSEIHRQAAGSPVIKLATYVRNGLSLEIGQYGESCIVRRLRREDNLLAHDQILVGTHNTRSKINNKVRQLLGYTSKTPQVGEKIICHKNDHSKSLYNGTIWKVVSVAATPKHGFITMEIIEEDDSEQKIIEITAPVDGFTMVKGNIGDLPGDPFAFAYAITVHKSQGSQWGSVCIIDDSERLAWGAEQNGETFDKSRWLYTAITRAEHRVTMGC